jgi:hypothetical protein
MLYVLSQENRPHTVRRACLWALVASIIILLVCNVSSVLNLIAPDAQLRSEMLHNFGSMIKDGVGHIDRLRFAPALFTMLFWASVGFMVYMVIMFLGLLATRVSRGHEIAFVYKRPDASAQKSMITHVALGWMFLVGSIILLLFLLVAGVRFALPRTNSLVYGALHHLTRPMSYANILLAPLLLAVLLTGIWLCWRCVRYYLANV